MKPGPIAVAFKLALASSAAAPAQPAPALTSDEAAAIATEAYVYGCPLVTMEMTRRVMTNVEQPEGTRAAMFNMRSMREYPTAAFRDVTAPNADTLFSVAWLDLAKEPWVLHIPDMGDRYFLFSMLSGWTEVFEVPGKRTGVFVDNPLNRYNLSSRSNLKPNPDGSVDLYIQKDSPGPDKEANWLPTPPGRFALMFRFYWPDDSIARGTWKPPVVRKVAP
jgi:hypothetical protein